MIKENVCFLYIGIVTAKTIKEQTGKNVINWQA